MSEIGSTATIEFESLPEHVIADRDTLPEAVAEDKTIIEEPATEEEIQEQELRLEEEAEKEAFLEDLDKSAVVDDSSREDERALQEKRRLIILAELLELRLRKKREQTEENDERENELLEQLAKITKALFGDVPSQESMQAERDLAREQGLHEIIIKYHGKQLQEKKGGLRAVGKNILTAYKISRQAKRTARVSAEKPWSFRKSDDAVQDQRSDLQRNQENGLDSSGNTAHIVQASSQD